jgi:hypothetical protein
VKKGVVTAFSVCVIIISLGGFQSLTASTQADSTVRAASTAHANWTLQPQGWEPDLWTGPNKWHTYSFNSDYAYTRFAGWNGVNSWGNTEYERGRDPWKAYGLPVDAVPLTAIQQLNVSLRVVEAKVDSKLGVASAYVDLWVNFSAPVGQDGLTWAELIVYLKTEKGVLYPFQEQESYSNRVCVDGNLKWYMIGYRCPDAGAVWSTRTIRINQLITRLADVYGVDISKGKVSCLAFGVEAAQGEMAAEWKSLIYEKV